jgi:hypothetical protein
VAELLIGMGGALRQWKGRLACRIARLTQFWGMFPSEQRQRRRADENIDALL